MAAIRGPARRPLIIRGGCRGSAPGFPFAARAGLSPHLGITFLFSKKRGTPFWSAGVNCPHNETEISFGSATKAPSRQSGPLENIRPGTDAIDRATCPLFYPFSPPLCVRARSTASEAPRLLLLCLSFLVFFCCAAPLFLRGGRILGKKKSQFALSVGRPYGPRVRIVCVDGGAILGRRQSARGTQR